MLGDCTNVAICLQFVERKQISCKLFTRNIYCTKSCANNFNRGWGGDIFSSYSNSTHSRGVSILLSKDIKYNIISIRNPKSKTVLIFFFFTHKRQ